MSEKVLVQKLSINSNLSEVQHVEAMIDHVCQEVGVSEDLYGNILIAVTEAVNNAIIHGNHGLVNAKVNVEAFEEHKTLEFVVEDQGKGFNYSDLPDPTAPENIEKENGRGIFLMRSLADEVEFNDIGNSVVIRFTSI